MRANVVVNRIILIVLLIVAVLMLAACAGDPCGTGYLYWPASGVGGGFYCLPLLF